MPFCNEHDNLIINNNMSNENILDSNKNHTDSNQNFNEHFQNQNTNKDESYIVINSTLSKK